MPRGYVAWLLGAPLSLATVMACSGSPPDSPAQPLPSAIVFATSAISVKEGHTGQITARVVDAAGHDVPGATVTFTTTDDTLITVTDDGLVNGVRPGAADIVATSGSLRADVTVDVIGHPEGLLVGTLPLSARPFGAAVSRMGTVYVTRLDADSLAITDVTSRALSGGIEVGSVPTGVTFDPAGTTAYVTNQFSHDVGIIDVATQTQIGTVPISGDPFVVITSPDASKMYVTDNTSWVFAISAATHTITDSISVGSAPNGFAVHPSDSIVYVSSAVGGTVAEINIRTDAVMRTFQVGGTPQDMIVSRDGKELYVANEAGRLDIWNLESGTETVSLPLPAGAFGMALSPDDAHLYLSLPDAGTVDVVDIPSRTIIHTIQVGGHPRRIAFDYHGGTAVVANEAGWVDFVR